MPNYNFDSAFLFLTLHKEGCFFHFRKKNVIKHLVFKALYFGGIYDTWALGGGDVRKITNVTLSPSIIFGYLLNSPSGGEGWIAPLTVEEQVMTIYTGTNGYLDSLWNEGSLFLF